MTLFLEYATKHAPYWMEIIVKYNCYWVYCCMLMNPAVSVVNAYTNIVFENNSIYFLNCWYTCMPISESCSVIFNTKISRQHGTIPRKVRKNKERRNVNVQGWQFITIKHLFLISRTNILVSTITILNFNSQPI